MRHTALRAQQQVLVRPCGRSLLRGRCSRRPGSSQRSAAAAAQPTTAFQQQQTNGASSSSSTTATQDIKAVSQRYIDQFVMPQARATLHVYKFHEDVFRQLLLTPDLDARLRSDKSLQWAAATVLAAVDEAVDIAYKGGRSHSSSPVGKSASSTARAAAAAGAAAAVAAAAGQGKDSTAAEPASSSSPEGSLNSLGDGMGAGEATAAHEFFHGHWPEQPASDEPGGDDAFAACTSTNDDEQCVMDWNALGCTDGAGGSLDDMQLPLVLPGVGATASMSMDSAHCADVAAARAAVKLEAALGEPFHVTAAQTFLQRLLYMINRLNHFWYDDLASYVNERSAWLAAVRERIEGPWQAWEQQQLLEAEGSAVDGKDPWRSLSLEDIKQGLVDRYEHDVDPPLSPAQQFISQDLDTLGYCHLLAVGALDGLVEASRQSRVCAGVANEVACTIFRVLMEEYGTGRYSRKHSTFYHKMMSELGLNTKEEAYLDIVPWQCLAASNHNFLLTERRRHYLRYAGALSFFEINGPSVYKTYLAAGQRCALSDDSTGYWALHIKEDERHGRQMLEEVALPLVDMYPQDCWEVLWGYDQDRFMGGRAGAALVAHIKAAAANAQAVTSMHHQQPS